MGMRCHTDLMAPNHIPEVQYEPLYGTLPVQLQMRIAPLQVGVLLFRGQKVQLRYNSACPLAGESWVPFLPSTESVHHPKVWIGFWACTQRNLGRFGLVGAAQGHQVFDPREKNPVQLNITKRIEPDQPWIAAMYY